MNKKNMKTEYNIAIFHLYFARINFFNDSNLFMCFQLSLSLFNLLNIIEMH